MKVNDLVRALEQRAMDKDKTVVVDVGRRPGFPGLIEVDGIRLGPRLIVLTLWRPR